MTPILTQLTPPWISALGWTLLHFIWQGTLLAALLFAWQTVVRPASARVRYFGACLALVFMAALPLATFVRLHKAYNSPWIEPALAFQPARTLLDVSLNNHASPANASPASAAGLDFALVEKWVAPLAPWLAWAWLAGLLLLSVRLLAGWARIQRIKAISIDPITAISSETARHISERLGIRRTVRLCRSAWVEAPTLVGWFRPVILFPAAALTGLTPGQLEAILAHELAHVRRRDFLVNLLQNVVETFLFYHPAVWWVSGQIRQERENCCDDLAVSTCGDPLRYAEALLVLEESRVDPWRQNLRFAVSAKGGLLLSRIRRLLGCPPQTPSPSAWLLAGAASFSAAAILLSNLHQPLFAGPSKNSIEKTNAPIPVPPSEKPAANTSQNVAAAAPQSPGAPQPEPLRTRTYRLPQGGIRRALEALERPPGTNPKAVPPLDAAEVAEVEMLRRFFAAAGVHFEDASSPPLPSPPSKSENAAKALFYNDRTGILFVRAPEKDLAVIDAAIQRLVPTPPQVSLEVKFVEVPYETAAGLGLSRTRPSQQVATEGLNSSTPQASSGFPLREAPTLASLTSNGPLRKIPAALGEREPGAALAGGANSVAALSGILTDAQFTALLRNLEQQAGVDVLAAPRVTTLSGREARIEVTQNKQLLFDGPAPETYDIATIAVGPSIHLIPNVSDGSDSIQMTVMPTLTEFLGYDDPRAAGVAADKQDQAPHTPALPRIRVRQILTTAAMRSGQTLMLLDLPQSEFRLSPKVPPAVVDPVPSRKSPEAAKKLIIFITPVIIDPAGNRVHQ